MMRACISIILMYALAATAAQAGRYNNVMDIGDPMPAFHSLPSTDGTKVSSTDLQASVVVLVSLANHCPWVRGMDPDLVKLVNRFEKEDVQFVGFAVNHREEDRLPAMKQHAEQYGYEFTYVYDESQQLGRLLGATRTPEYFVFNQDRRLIYTGLLYNSPARINSEGVSQHIAGPVTEHYVADAIESTLAGKPVAVSETRAHGCSVKYQQ